MPTVALCMIVRNVEQTIGPCLESIAPFVDEVVIVDTGSSDGTKAAIGRVTPSARILYFTPQTHPQAFLLDSADAYEPELGPFTGKPFLGDFAAARNLGWQVAKSDYRIWVDSDDIVVGGDKLWAVIADMETGGYQMAFLNYDYNTNAEGQVTIQNWRERIFHRETNAAWVGRVHEVCIPPGPMKTYTEVNIVHKRREYSIQPEVANRNLKILIPWLKSQGEKVDPRILYYLATEERFIWPDRALADIKRYVQVSGSRDEIASAHIYAGEIQERSDRLYEALADYSLAAMWNPLNADAFFGAARVAYRRVRRDQGNWDEVLTRTERGFAVADTFTTLAKDPTTRASMPYVYYAIALVQTQQYDKGLKACDEGLKHFKPGSEEYGWLMGNRESCLTALNPNKVLIHLKRNEPLDAPSRDISQEVLRSMAIQIWKKIKESGDEKRANWFAQALPPEYTWTTEVGSSKPKPKTGLDIVIWTGPAWEKWGPKNLEIGLGGSELAAIYIARELSRLGHHVRVYSDCREDAGIYDNVEYIHYDKSHVFETDVLIVSRAAAAIPVYGGKAKLKILWAHDVHAGMDPNAIDGVKAADLIFCLSNWHKDYFCSFYPSLDRERVVVTRNGIDVARFAAEPKKIGNRLIFTSSPDRGLDRLLDLFPRIKDQVPDAELHVYYGFVTWEKMAELRNDQPARDQIANFKRRMAETPGVVAHGRVGQKELAEAFSASKVLTYPTAFTETSMIGAMEAQAAGCIPVTTALAALNETVKHGILIQPPHDDERYAKAFVGHVVGILQSEHERWTLGSAGRAHGLTLGWDRVAAEWATLFEKKLGRAPAIEAVTPVPAPPKKIVFVYDHPHVETWRDGLWAALQLLAKDYTVEYINLSKGEKPYEGNHVLLAWGAFGSAPEMVCRSFSCKKALCLGGTRPAAPEVAGAWDAIFGETDWAIEHILKPTGHKQIFKAFGVNTDIYKPLGREKMYDWISVGAFTSWKRQSLIGGKSGRRLVVGGFHKHHADESAPIVRDLMLNGVETKPAVPPEELAKLYSESRICYIPADVNGGGERAVLEARACGLPVAVESDNPKLQELTTGPVPSHREYAASLRAGLDVVTGTTRSVDNVDVVMPVWATDEETMTLTKAAIDSLGIFPGKLIIIDNGSTVGAERLAEWADVLVRNENNLGYAVAVNQGLALTGDIVAVANNDIRVSPNWWTVAKEILQDPKAGSVHFRMLPYNEPFSFGEGIAKTGRERWCSSSFFIVRNVLRFDESLESGEDYDFWYRFQRGYQTVYTDRAAYQHLDSHSQQKRPDRAEYSARGKEQYKAKYGVSAEEQFARRFPEQMQEPWKPFPTTKPAPVASPKVSVLVMMSRPGGVDITFASLRDQTYKNFETIIVDSRYEKRHDAILKMAERYGLRDVIHVPEHRRNGKWIVACAAFNTAMALARGEIVIIMHDFMYAQPGWIESHVRAHEGAQKRHVVGNHANVDLPELSVTLPEYFETDRAIVEHDSAFEKLDELCIFKKGEFDPSWPVVVGQKQWQPVFSSWFHAGRKPGKGWVTLTNDSFRREFLWDLGGINERFDHGRGPFDMEISSRVYAAGGEAVYIDQPCPPIFNPRFVMRSLPFGNHKQNVSDGVDQRWTEADGVAHWHHVDAAGLKTAPNPYTMRELAARLAPWREPGAKCVPQDVSNVAYFRRKLRPTDP